MTLCNSTSVKSYAFVGSDLQVVFHSNTDVKYTYPGGMFLFVGLMTSGKSVGQAVAGLKGADWPFKKESVYA